MFSKFVNRNQQDEEAHIFPELIIKYPNPKILLIDLKDTLSDVLRSEGYNISVGSFGTPYNVEKSDKYVPIVENRIMPSNYAEQEIVVIDLMPNAPIDERGDKQSSLGTIDWWASCKFGFVDPRPRTMATTREKWEQILLHNGVIIIFAMPRIEQEFVEAYVESGWGQSLSIGNRISADNWSFLSTTPGINISPYEGEQIIIEFPESAVGRCLQEYSDETFITCTLNPNWKGIKENWTPLAKNKYGDCVAGELFTKAIDGNGVVFIFPQIKEKSGFLVKFFKEVLPDIQSRLFPYVEGKKWVQRPEYELPEIIQIQTKIQEIREKAEQEISALQAEIELERSGMGFLHDLLREFDRPLVVAVKSALEILGFQNVVDVDEEVEQSGEDEEQREDLQIHDKSPILLIEVKGIGGLPKDEDALAVRKYIAPRMQEWERLDVKGLTIINHNRHMLGLERENNMLFRDVQITNAKQSKFGLLTTWDLFRLVRSYLKNGWKFEHVIDLFYQNGRIEPIPTHYKFLGVIEHYFPEPEAVIIQLLEDDLSLGDRIAFELSVEFEEQQVDSLQDKNDVVERIGIGEFAGIKTHLNKSQARRGVRVFLVS